MRNLFLSILLATTAAVATPPALAQSTDREERAKEREERTKEREERQSKRSEAREERQSKSTKAAEEAKPTQPAAREERGQVREDRSKAREKRVQVREEGVQQRAGGSTEERRRPVLRPDRSAIIDQQEERREIMDQRRQTAGQREQAQQQRQESRDRLDQQRQESRERFAERVRQRQTIPPPSGARPDRPAPPPPVVESSRPSPTWNTNHWRRDNRHDWRRWRDRNRSLFRLGFYFDPFGWNYRRWGVGWRLWPAYYNEYYWLDDPWTYRLPYAPWPYKWVRYYHDALLVNVFTGQVVDVEYDFFW